MSVQQKQKKRLIYQVSIVIALVFLLSFSGMYLVERVGEGLTGATIRVIDISSNASLDLFDSGDIINDSNPLRGSEQINNLLNDTSNVFFYALFGNGTEESVVGQAGSGCDIEFESAIGPVDTGPFTMTNNGQLVLFEYNKSFPNNGTFRYNVTCSNSNLGVGPISASDEFRIFDHSCEIPSANEKNSIFNNTILCGGLVTYDAVDPAIAFGENNITLDCNGTTIYGSDNDYGIELGGFNGTIIKNCIFANFTEDIMSNPNSFKDNILIFNNTFTNMSKWGANLSNVGNITFKSNNFTNISDHAIFADDVDNLNVTSNRFCNVDDNVLGINTSGSNITIQNNILCVNQITPQNNTVQNDINFTFNVPALGMSLDFNRTCNLLINDVANGVTDFNITPSRNVTLNGSINPSVDFNWSINCTDIHNNVGTSDVFNATYEACTVPTASFAPPNQTNVTFCPGEYNIHPQLMSVGTADSIYNCNNTEFRGNLSESFVTFGQGVQEVTVQHCIASNYTVGFDVGTALPLPINVTLFNNTISNVSAQGVTMTGGTGWNVTENTFINASQPIEIVNGGNHTIINNTIIDGVQFGITFDNTSDNTLLDNNISNSTGVGITIYSRNHEEGGPSQVTWNNLFANNTICDSDQEAILVNNTLFSPEFTMDGLISNNTICNATTGSTNRNMARLLWELDAHVVNATNESMTDVNINVTNTLNEIVQTNLGVNGTGYTSAFNITQFIVNNTNDLVNVTPTNFVFARGTEKSNISTLINQVSIFGLSTSILLNLSQDATAPNVTQITPTTATLSVPVNLQATANDTSGIQGCNLFVAQAGSPVVDNGAMEYNRTSGVVNMTYTFNGAIGSYNAYANCSDNGNNVAFNETTITVAALTSGGGDNAEASPEHEGGEGLDPDADAEASPEHEGGEGLDPDAEAGPEYEEGTEADKRDAAADTMGDYDEEDIEKMIEGDILTVEYGLEINEVYANDELVYKDGVQENTITIKDEDILTLEFILTNTEDGDIEDIVIGLTNLPDEITVNNIDPQITGVLPPGESKTITIELESGDLTETFLLMIHAESAEASAIIAISTVLEEGKGAVYYTRQKVIEETTEVVVRTYKILLILFIIPLLLLLRATTIGDENSIRRMLEDKKIDNYWRIYVTEKVQTKYNSIQHLKAIKVDDKDMEKANVISKEMKISYELATLIVYAQHTLIPRIFTMEEIPVTLRHHFHRIWFTSPLHNYKEEQMKRYIEVQQQQGFTNNKIRQTLFKAGWKKEIVKKYLDPKADLELHIKDQQRKGHSLGLIRKQLLDVKWEKAVVDNIIPREKVLEEYITQQRAKMKSNEVIRKALIAAGWEKNLVYKHLDPEADLKAYIVTQLQRGISKKDLKKSLIKRGWKKSSVEKFLPSK